MWSIKAHGLENDSISWLTN